MLNDHVLRALNLDSDEAIVINIIPRLKERSPSSPPNLILGFRILTSKRLVHLDYWARKRQAEITDDLFFTDIDELTVAMRNVQHDKEPLFYLAVTKAPVLSIKAKEKTYDLPLRAVFFLKKKISKLVDCVEKANPQVNIRIDYHKRDTAEALNEMIFEGVADNKRKPLKILLILFIIGLAIVIWRLALFLKTVRLE